MAFCPNCGAQVEGKFCAKCGSAVAAAPDPGGYTAPPPGGGYTPPPGGGYAPPPGGGGYAPPPAAPQASGLETNVACALCYSLTILTGILFLVLEPYNKNKLIRFHAFQAIFFWVACVAVLIGVSILSMAFSILGLFVFGLLHMVIYLACFATWVFLIFKAYNNEKIVLPIIGPIAEKQA